MARTIEHLQHILLFHCYFDFGFEIGWLIWNFSLSNLAISFFEVNVVFCSFTFNLKYIACLDFPDQISISYSLDTIENLK